MSETNGGKGAVSKKGDAQTPIQPVNAELEAIKMKMVYNLVMGICITIIACSAMFSVGDNVVIQAIIAILGIISCAALIVVASFFDNVFGGKR